MKSRSASACQVVWSDQSALVKMSTFCSSAGGATIEMGIRNLRPGVPGFRFWLLCCGKHLQIKIILIVRETVLKIAQSVLRCFSSLHGMCFLGLVSLFSRNSWPVVDLLVWNRDSHHHLPSGHPPGTSVQVVTSPDFQVSPVSTRQLVSPLLCVASCNSSPSLPDVSPWALSWFKGDAQGRC